MTDPTPPTPVQVALDRLADVLGGLGVWGRVPLAIVCLREMADQTRTADHREVFRSLHDLVEGLDAEETQPQQRKDDTQ